ncbi:MAG: hypothetical protein ACRDOK_11730, partial [Streptosporangiaceae bacterium]
DADDAGCGRGELRGAARPGRALPPGPAQAPVQVSAESAVGPRVRRHWSWTTQQAGGIRPARAWLT